MLGFLHKGHYFVQAKGLWIVDDSDFANLGTICLIDRLRHRASHEKEGSVYSFAATGWNIQTQSFEIRDGSNYVIEDVEMLEDEMEKSMSEE